MTFYSGKGDDGRTGLLGGGRVPKFHLRIEALGALDESSAALGLARAATRDPHLSALVLEIQRDLYRLMAEVASAPGNADPFHFDAGRVQWLEAQIDHVGQGVDLPREFILPGDSSAGAAASLARAVVRRAERRVVELFDAGEIHNPALQQYLNRLSSLLFVLELMENKLAGAGTTMARKAGGQPPPETP